ncbi:MAG: carboxypeptidase-like regulatory domain-containing protein [Flavobacteriaceae bacterium]|nr:carboxypeptidase-like regulatory domain-containing protein [Flavobacteriaceae bacterium]
MKKTFLIFVFLISRLCLAQQVYFEGRVQDSLGQGLEGTNVLLYPVQKKYSMLATTTDATGSFSLKVNPNLVYQVYLSHLGFRSKVFRWWAQQSLKKTYQLQAFYNQLEEVVVAQNLPIKQKKDTTVFQTSFFSNGQEHKLKNLLGKLPGVEIDRYGNVWYGGKSITKILVEGRLFFTGSTKLAVNQIPAHAIEAIEVIDNFDEIALLSAFNDQKETIINIRLKEDKKKLVFGDTKIGGGLEGRYHMHPTLFYYGEALQGSIMATKNNTGEQIFELEDYLNFEGGLLHLFDQTEMGRESGALQFLQKEDRYRAQTHFFASNLSAPINSKLDFNGYVLFSQKDMSSKKQRHIRYRIPSQPLEETQQINQQADNHHLLVKLDWKYKPHRKTEIRNYSLIKSGHSSFNRHINRNTPIDQYNTQYQHQEQYHQFTHHFLHLYRASRKHSLQTQFRLENYSQNPENRFGSNQAILPAYIQPIIKENHQLLDRQKNRSHRLHIAFKDYWSIAALHHIYIGIGGYLVDQKRRFSLWQPHPVYPDELAIDPDRFHSASKLKIWDNYFSLEYKTQIGNWQFRPQLYWYFFRKQGHLPNKLYRDRQALLPRLHIQYHHPKGGKLELTYALQNQRNQLAQLSQTSRMEGFYSLYSGSPSLEDPLYHQSQISYHRFELKNRMFIRTQLEWKHYAQTVKRNTVLSPQLEQLQQEQSWGRSENHYRLYARAKRRFGKWQLGIQFRLTHKDFYQITNHQAQKNNTNSLYNRIELTSKFHPSAPQFSISASKNLRYFNDFRVDQNQIHSQLTYAFHRDWELQLDHDYQHYHSLNDQSNLQYQLLHFSLQYAKNNSGWRAQIQAKNLLNVEQKRSYQFSDFSTQEETIWILPRMLLFHIIYNF